MQDKKTPIKYGSFNIILSYIRIFPCFRLGVSTALFSNLQNAFSSFFEVYCEYYFFEKLC